MPIIPNHPKGRALNAEGGAGSLIPIAPIFRGKLSLNSARTVAAPAGKQYARNAAIRSFKHHLDQESKQTITAKNAAGQMKTGRRTRIAPGADSPASIAGANSGSAKTTSERTFSTQTKPLALSPGARTAARNGAKPINAMKMKPMFQTRDGLVHNTQADAEKHLDNLYGAALTKIAHQIVRTDKYVPACDLIEKHLADFVELSAIRADMHLEPPEDEA